MEFNPAIPIYTQLMDTFKRLIYSGVWQPGAKVPPVRELALEFGVNPNTLQRALNELEREGLMYTERTAGRFVTEERSLIASLKQRLILDLAHEFMKEMKLLGCSQQEAAELIRKWREDE